METALTWNDMLGPIEDTATVIPNGMTSDRIGDAAYRISFKDRTVGYVHSEAMADDPSDKSAPRAWFMQPYGAKRYTGPFASMQAAVIALTFNLARAA
jgi:hypothetical protein